ncbi:MAG: glycosyltransferase, partial [Bacteroidota bacterium]
MSRALVITPTYNESENVSKLIDEVLKQDESLEILIVDDNSPDGTASIVKSIQQTNTRVHLIERPRKMGLGTAYVAGFKYAIQNNYDFVVETACDPTMEACF